MYSKVLIIGRVVNDPSIRYSPTGKAVVNLSIAVDRYKADKVETDFFEVIAFEKEAERADKFLRKGRLIMVEGRLQTREYEAQDGSRRKVYEIILETFRMLDKKPEEMGAVSDYTKESRSSEKTLEDKTFGSTEKYEKKGYQLKSPQKQEKPISFNEDDDEIFQERYTKQKPKKEKYIDEEFDDFFFDEE